MNDAPFTKLPSKKRVRKRKSRTKSTLEQELGAVQKEIERGKDRVQKARTKRKTLKKAEKLLETGRGIVSEEELSDLPDIVSDEIKKQKVLFEPLVNPVTGRSVQREFLEASEDEVLFAGGRGPLVYGEKVLTKNGWRTIEQVKVGDWVRCPDGTLSQIIAEPFDGEDDCYEIEFIDGRKVKVGASHLWEVAIVGRTLKAGSRREVLRTTQWMYDHYKAHVETADNPEGDKTTRNILIPLCKPVIIRQQSKINFEIDPYLLGLLLGDGCISQTEISLTTIDDEIVQSCATLHAEGVSVYGKTVRFVKPVHLRNNLKRFGLFGTKSGTKFIPSKYKNAEPSIRLAVLQGLMDTDGTAGKDGHVSFCSISKQLAEDVQYLVRSLGGKATITTKQPFYYGEDRNKISGKLAYIVYINIEDSSQLFRLTRKKERATKNFNGGISEAKLRVKAITPIGKLRCKCITIDDPRGLFLTNDFIVTHNSGKSQALIVALLRPEYITNRNYRALVIRRTMRELKDLITKAKAIIFDAVPGSKWKTQDNTFYFPSGASIEFGYCENDDDVERYRGREFSILAIDELTMIPTEEMYISLMSSIRNVDPTLPTQVLASTNPYGVGFNWVKKRFVNRGPENTTIVIKHTNDFTGQTYITTRKWLQSNFQDNPLIKDAYIASMASLPEEKRKRWMEGTWDGGDGMAFPEFDREKHVIKPFAIPATWPRFRACDWGYSTMAVVLWFAVDPEGALYCYREFVTSHMTADKFAQEVLRLERGERIKYGVIDGNVGDKRGSSAPSLDEEMRKQGCIWRYADKTAGSRMSGKNLIHKHLAVDNALNKPRLQFFETCTEIIEELSSLPSDQDNPDDVDTDAKDHAYDALRFAILSRPKSGPSGPDSPQYKQPPIIFNSTFGY